MCNFGTDDKNTQVQIELLGVSYYFTRKGVQTSYDVQIPGSESTITNPLPLIQNAFDALQASDNQHAYHFLNEVRKLMAGAHNKERQLVVMLNLKDVLPGLTDRYRRELTQLETSQGTTVSESQKNKLKEKYQNTLNIFIDYLN